MRYLDILNERAANLTGTSKYIGRRSGRTYYIAHRLDGGLVQCRAILAATNPFQELRERVAVVSAVMVRGDDTESLRNNIRVYSAKSVVNELYRRDGLLGAMYDHLDNNGFVVYPADGSVGEAYAQAQSEDAVAFWRARRMRNREATLYPATEAELYGWHDPMKEPPEMLGLPVIERVKIHGYANPMLVLWQKTYSRYVVDLGVMYDSERGFRFHARITLPDDSIETFGYHDGTRLVFPSYAQRFARLLPAGAYTVASKLAERLEEERQRAAS